MSISSIKEFIYSVNQEYDSGKYESIIKLLASEDRTVVFNNLRMLNVIEREIKSNWINLDNRDKKLIKDFFRAIDNSDIKDVELELAPVRFFSKYVDLRFLGEELAGNHITLVERIKSIKELLEDKLVALTHISIEELKDFIENKNRVSKYKDSAKYVELYNLSNQETVYISDLINNLNFHIIEGTIDTEVKTLYFKFLRDLANSWVIHLLKVIWSLLKANEVRRRILVELASGLDLSYELLEKEEAKLKVESISKLFNGEL